MDNILRKTKYVGVSLVETVVYIALFGIIFISVIQFLLSTVESNRMTTDRIDIDRYKLLVYEHLDEHIQWASTINEGGSVFDSTNGILALANGADTLNYSLSGGELIVTRNGVAQSLTPQDISVTNFTLDEMYDVSNNLVGVKIQVDFNLISNSDVTESITHIYRLY